MQTIRWLRPLVLSVSLLACFAQAKINILTSHEPPMNFERHGQVEGIITDYVSLLMQQVGEQSAIQIAPWARVMEAGMTLPNTLIFSAERSPQRETSFHWIGPVLAKHWYFIARDPARFPYQQLEQFKQVEHIGVLRADNRETWLKDQGFTNYYPLSTLDQAYKMLMSRRVDLVLTGDIEHAYMLAHHPEYQSLSKVHYVNTAYSYLALSRGTDPAVVQQWQNAFAREKDSAELINIQHRWSDKLGRAVQLNNGMFELPHE